MAFFSLFRCLTETFDFDFSLASRLYLQEAQRDAGLLASLSIYASNNDDCRDYGQETPPPNLRNIRVGVDCSVVLQAGFLSTGKKASIFSVPENPQAKVGVVGSGKGMTDYKTNNRHDFAAE